MNKNLALWLLIVTIFFQPKTVTQSLEGASLDHEEFTAESFRNLQLEQAAHIPHFKTPEAEQYVGPLLVMLDEFLLLDHVNPQLKNAVAQKPSMSQEEYDQLKNKLLDINSSKALEVFEACKGPLVYHLENPGKTLSILEKQVKIVLAAARPGSIIELPEAEKALLQKDYLAERAAADAHARLEEQLRAHLAMPAQADEYQGDRSAQN